MTDAALSIGINNPILERDMAKRKYEQTMLGNWLREARAGRSQKEVAERIEMDQAEWSRWERGERMSPKPHQIEAFATALGVSRESVALAYAGIWPGSASSQALPHDVTLVYAVSEMVEQVLEWSQKYLGEDAAADMLKNLRRGQD